MIKVLVYQYVTPTLYAMATYRLFDGGLSKALVLEELTHGTDPISNIRIRFFGGLPSTVGSRPNYYTNTVGYFYLYKDSEYGYRGGKQPLIQYQDEGVQKTMLRVRWEGRFVEKLPVCDYVKTSLAVAWSRYTWRRDNIAMASFMKLYGNIPQRPGIIDMAVYNLSPLICPPILRFRFAKIDPTRLEEDDNQWGISYKTNKVVEVWRLGPLGSCLAGINRDWLTRVQNNPVKAVTGMAQLGTAAALALIGRSKFPGKIPLMIVGAALA